jgi:hypothetical protein
MRIFVAYGYNDRDRWIPNFIFPIIRAFGDEVVTGEDLQGELITDAIRKSIKDSDALIAFTTRRDPIGQDRWSTHRWVTDELSQALAYNLPVVEVRERGVDDQGGIAGDRQRITYDENQRDKCLVELVKTIGGWHQGNTIKLQLLPDEFVQYIRPLLRQPNLHCTYRLLGAEDDSPGEEMPTTILPITGGLFVHAKNVPRASLIQIRVECSGKSWASSFESVDSLGIHLQQD